MGLIHELIGVCMCISVALSRDGRTTCESEGDPGVCFSPLDCLRVAGVFGNNCPGSQGVCCLCK